MANLFSSFTSTKMRILPWVIAIAMFMETLDSTIVGVAIPSIARTFHINPVDMKLALTSYLLSLAVFIPISGWLADRYGEKKTFIAAMLIFTLSSIACAFSYNLSLLILFRFIQGFGGALMMPVGRLIIMRNFSREDFPKAMGSVIIPGLVGPALGPTLGGIILHFTTWHWIFMMNVPFGILGIIVGYLMIPEPKNNETIPPFNWLGFILFSMGLSFITLSMAILGDKFTLFKPALILAISAAVLLTIYTYLSLKQPNPMLDLRLFKQKTFCIAMVVSGVSRIGVGAIPFLIPLLLQILWGRNALFSGSIFVFQAAGMMSTRLFLNQRLLARYGYRRLLTINIILLSILSMNLCWFSTPHSIFLLYLLMFFIGVLTSQLYMGIGTLYPLQLESSQFSHGTSIASTIQQFSMGFGVACAAIALHLIAQITHHPVFSKTVFFWTFIILNLIGFFSVFFTIKLDKTLGIKSAAR